MKVNILFLFAASFLWDPAVSAKLALIMLDGFRWDYVERLSEQQVPVFKKFLETGVQAEYVQPIFPSVSFPSWTTISTGEKETRRLLLLMVNTSGSQAKGRRTTGSSGTTCTTGRRGRSFPCRGSTCRGTRATTQVGGTSTSRYGRPPPRKVPYKKQKASKWFLAISLSQA